MGEQKRRNEKKTDFERLTQGIERELHAKGLYIKAGWEAYNRLVLPKDAGTIQRDECRLAFYAGVQHLWAAIMRELSPGKDITPADERRMEAIGNEIETIREELLREMAIRTAKMQSPAGSA